jgi:uncharacterized protein (DUF362 family)
MVKLLTSVAVIKGEQPAKMVNQALDLIDAHEFIQPDDKVLIKPNYVMAKHPSSGITTDSRIVESLIEFVKQVGVTDIIVGEGGAGNTEKAFDIVGIREVVKRQQVQLVNLNRDRRINVSLKHPLALGEVGVAETMLNSTCIINVPKLKVHHLTTVTLSMKNLMGGILPKSIIHHQIHRKIVDLASLFKDKVRLNVVDGIVGAEESEVYGTPVKMNLIIAGQDMVAVDTVAATIMGMNPQQITYLQLAEANGLGITKLRKIQIHGEKIAAVTKTFKI